MRGNCVGAESATAGNAVPSFFVVRGRGGGPEEPARGRGSSSSSLFLRFRVPKGSTVIAMYYGGVGVHGQGGRQLVLRHLSSIHCFVKPSKGRPGGSSLRYRRAGARASIDVATGPNSSVELVEVTTHARVSSSDYLEQNIR